MSTTFQLVAIEGVYLHSTRKIEFEATIGWIHRILHRKPKRSTFDALHKAITEKWLFRDDVMKPFGNERGNLQFVWTFNLSQDRLFYSDRNGHSQIPLARIRKPGSEPPQQSEFTPYEFPSSPQLDLAEFPPPYHKFSRPIPERRVVFGSRLLSDFADKWRHCLRSSSPYAESTFLKFAKAVVSIATCDIQIKELSIEEHISRKRLYSYGSTFDVPSWEPFKRHIFSIGDTTVVLHQELRTALDMAKENAIQAKKRTKAMRSGDRTKQRTYLLLSIRHMLVCRIALNGTISYSAPVTFMDGQTLPSPAAINLLLQALLPAQSPPHTSLHNLPLEIQDQILRHVSKGPVEAARLGCVLGLGSPITWMRDVDWPRQGGPLDISPRPAHRTETTPVESKICFGDEFSGVAYK